tara:strand:- start:113 stop:697 length:585 start_codon:yes stop_codon:yes gene_type:complete
MDKIEQENNIDVFAIYALGTMGVILSTFFTNNNNDYGTVIGNSVIIITSVILIFMILYVYKFNSNDTSTTSDHIGTILGTINNISINTIINQGLPILLLIIGLVYITILNITYRDKHILPGYTLYNSIFQYIVIIQLLLIYKMSWTIIIDKNIDNTSSNKINIQQLFTIIVGVINLAIATIIHIILKSYSITDE